MSMFRILLFITVAICALWQYGICSVSPLPLNISNVQINKDVQLKDNGYVKIIKEEYEELTEKDVYEIEKRNGINAEPPKYPNQVYARYINIKIQFLKPCAASINEEENTKWKMWMENLMDGKKYIGIEPSVTDAFIPKYYCDYRAKVFTTFFSLDGKEIRTIGQYVSVSKDSYNNKYKMEILPGESTHTSFVVPKGAAYYYTWVPK